MERLDSDNRMEHVIDITGNGDASASSAPHDRHSDGVETLRREDRPSDSARASSETSVYVSNSRSTLARSADMRHRRCPLSSGFRISFEVTTTISQIVIAIIVLYFSRHEHSRAPLFIWIVGYASGCAATLPPLCWQCLCLNQISVQNSTEERVNVLMVYLRTASNHFMAIWFVVGTIWVFIGHSSISEAPNLYWLCVLFLAISFIGYVMPVILCPTMFYCLPCIIVILGFREESTQKKGATKESINSLPIYKFKMKKNENGDEASTAEGGVMAAGSSKERLITGEDAVCCICLAKYVNNDYLRELPCSHLFHKVCVDKWLKINASCPLCKIEVGQTVSAAKGSQQPGQNVVGSSTGLAGNVS